MLHDELPRQKRERVGGPFRMGDLRLSLGRYAVTRRIAPERLLPQDLNGQSASSGERQ